MPFQPDSPQSDPVSVEQVLAEAITHHQAGRLSEAEQLYRTVIKAAPHQISALYRLGVLCFQDGRPDQALPFLEVALKLQPHNPNILNSLGVALQNAGRDQEAVMRFRQAIAINPTDIGTLGNLGRALREQGNFESALECFKKIVQASPHPDIYIEIGRCYYEMGNFQQAILYFEKVLSQTPDYIDALSALGSALWAMGRRTDARGKFDRALQIEPNDAKVILNLGEFLYDERNIDEALEHFDRALTLAPEYNNAVWRKSFALLAKGEYREGWKLYAACLGGRDTRGFNRFAPMKPWNGNSIPNKHLLIWCEQGLGDSLQFIRYAELCKRRVGRVSVFCQKPLVRLFKALPFIDYASDSCDRSKFDEHVPIMNLPHVFDTVLETVPAAIPYLHIDSTITAKWQMRFEDVADPNGLKVGLVWAGGAHEDNIAAKLSDLQRSIGLERMKPWFSLRGVKFFSLQKDKPAEQIETLGLADHFTDFMGDVTDFADTAAIIQNLDLIITVDTAVAHLAGGLGKPVWIMSRYNADWRWLQNRPTNPWYPTARIFGQPSMGDWDSVLAEVERELMLEITKKHSR